MNKKQTTMLASIAATTLVGAMLSLSGILGTATGLANVGGPDYTTAPQGQLGDLNGQVTKLVVEIESPFGFERITSFKVFQTDNLMKQSGYYTLRLFGPIMSDKVTLLHWIARDMGQLPAGLHVALPITTGGGKPAVMTSAPSGTTITKIPMSGRIVVSLFEANQDFYSQGNPEIRKLEYSGCHVAGYHMGSNYDDEKSYFKDGLQHYEEIDFACTGIKDLKSRSANNVRGIMVETALNNDNRQITNEKGELITTAREYRQPIVLENKQVEETNSLKPEIVTRITLDKTSYKVGDRAVFTVTFADLEGSPIEPNSIRAIYNGESVELQKQDTGLYTFTTKPLIKEHQQLIVSAEKSGFPTDTTYMSLPIHRIS
jgi:hypothetical protein